MSREDETIILEDWTQLSTVFVDLAAILVLIQALKQVCGVSDD